jgi:hypothetical protein
MTSDPSVFLGELDARVTAYLNEIRERAESVKVGLASGITALRAKSEPVVEPNDGSHPLDTSIFDDRSPS